MGWGGGIVCGDVIVAGGEVSTRLTAWRICFDVFLFFCVPGTRNVKFVFVFAARERCGGGKYSSRLVEPQQPFSHG